jgi:hypothetical protein
LKTLLIICCIVTFLSSSTCNKAANNSDIRGKIVYRSCATVAVQVLDEAHFSLAQSSWEQDPSKPAFKNVFAVANPCDLPQIDTGKVFSFKLIKNGKNDCIVCAMWDNPPQVKHQIKVTSK